MSESQLHAGESDADEQALEPDMPEGRAGDVLDEPEPDGPAAPSGSAPEGAEPETDPVAEFKRQLRMLPGDWYVVHSYAGYENRVKANLESRIQSLNMEDYIFQVEIGRAHV